MLVPAYMYLAKTRSPFLHHSVSTTISFIQIAPGLLCSVKLCKRLADARRPGYLFFFFFFGLHKTSIHNRTQCAVGLYGSVGFANADLDNSLFCPLLFL